MKRTGYIQGFILRCIAAAGAAAIALLPGACTGTIAVYDDTQTEIGLSPVTRPDTKIISGGMETTFDGYETFGVFAYHKITGAGQTWEAFTSAGGDMNTYLYKVPFCKRAAGDSYWGGGKNEVPLVYERATGSPDYVKGTSYIALSETEVFSTVERAPQYWPNTGSLIFAGYSPYQTFDFYETTEEVDNEEVTVEHRDFVPIDAVYDIDEAGGYANPGLTVKDFRQGDYNWEHDNHWAENETFDFMWFETDDAGNMSFDSSTEAIPVTFKHACAWLDFRITAETPGLFSISEVTLSDIYWQADFDSREDGCWSNFRYDTGANGDVRETVLFSHDGDRDMEEPDPDEIEFVKVDEKGFFLGDMIVIPQPVSDEAAGKESVLVIEYLQHTSDDTPLTQTYVCPLDSVTENGRWEMGKHYIYDIVFALHKITVEPDVLEWEERPGSVTVN